jgi:hypothetical protein
MRFSSAFLLLVVLVGCASNPPPPAATVASTPSTTPVDTAPSASATAAPPATSLESQREPFMAGCMKKVPAPDYCACGFDQFREVFKGADVSQNLADDDPRLSALRDKTQANCASKIPEDIVKTSFFKTCSSDDARRGPYCKCAWSSLRKTLAVADFVAGLEGPRSDEAKKAMVVSCKGTFPADSAKSDFVTACEKQDPSRAKTCDCLWKMVRAKFSVEEIVAGTADVKSIPGLDKCTTKGP